MKRCKCEHWQTCPTCRPQLFDADGNRLPPPLTPLEAAHKEIAELKKTAERYSELIMAVGNKYQNESRHETALRYIRAAESSANAMLAKNGGTAP